MTLWVTITNENTSDLAPLYTTTLLIFRGVEVEQSSWGIRAGVAPSALTRPHPMPSPTRGEGALITPVTPPGVMPPAHLI